MSEKLHLDKEQVEILIVEDSPTQALQLKYLLEQNQFKVSVAENGQQALDLLCEEHPSIVISDIIMPLMNGYELCKRLKDNQETQNIPVILLTSLSDSEDVLEGLSCGADNFITKPYSEEYLVAAINQILSTIRLRKDERVRVGVEIMFGGKRRFITADQQQTLTLLISTYEAAVHKNKELIKTQEELRSLNEQLESRVEERTVDLAKRAKELKCLYAISSLAAKPCGSTDEALKIAVDLIPQGWQYPEITCARIVFEGREFTSANFRDTAWKQSSDIAISEKIVGVVDVRYLEERPEADEGPFLKEEHDLVIDIARQLGVMIERNRAEKHQQLAREVLELLNKPEDAMDLVHEILQHIKKNTGFEAVDIRLPEGDDSSYYVTSGFSEEFVQAERCLYAYDEAGNLVRDDSGKPMLECMCGKVLCGRTDPQKPFFTEGGSFWSNGTTEFLATTTEKDRLAHTCNRCNGEGYESVALIPLRSGNEIIGLLQLNDRRTNQFSQEMIYFFEGLGASIGISLARKRAQEALHESEDKHRIYVENAPDGIFVVNATGAFIDVNQAACHMTGYSKNELLNMTIQELTSPEALHESIETFTKLQEKGEVNSEVILRKKDGSDFMASLNAVVITGDRFMAFCSDITEHKQIEIQFRELFQTISSGVAIFEAVDNGFDFIFTRLNRAGEQTDGLKNDEVKGRKVTEVFPAIEEFGLLDVLKRVWKTGCSENHPVSLYKDDRISGWRENQVFKLPSGEVVAVYEDMTDQKKAEEEKAGLEEQFRQAQKMESIGRLAGGVAHDFNNLLTAISGFSDLVYDSLGKNDPMREDIAEIQKAADSAATLTSQLLAFSRKQIISPKVLEISKTVAHSEKMLRRIIGEDIDFVFISDENIGNVLLDPGQVDQILVNLAVNARDAMPGVGKLTIETKNVTLEGNKCQSCDNVMMGEYVMLSVSDTGEGMDAATMKNIFEPFFTTKEKGKGTGLGLSTVHGIVHQSNGHLNVYSELGMGTTFKIYLPVVHDEARPVRTVEKPVQTQGNETILLVEDQEIVRKLAVRTLAAQGYAIIEAQHGGEALLKCEEAEGKIDLLLTDVIMPQMGGKQLHERLVKIVPGLKVLFMSGYTANAIAHQGVLDAGTNFIQKPFRPQELAIKVRQVLDAPGPEKAGEEESTGGGTILVIDDEEMMRELYTIHIEPMGFEVICASDGKQGLEAFKANAEKVSLVILDQSMPDMNGSEVLRKIREMNADVPVIISSGFGSEDIAESLEKSKHVSFLAKPFKRKDFEEAVNRVVHTSKKADLDKSVIPGTILIVDDDESIRSLLSVHVKSAGFEVICASDGEGGLKAFFANSKKISLVILDQNMPKMSGATMLQEIRKTNRKIPAIISSGDTSDNLDEAFKAFENISFLHRLFNRKDVVEAINKALQKKK